jgi:hypothetical protein
MNALSHIDRFYLEAAEGWLMLGNPLEANEELERIDSENAYHPGVLAMRWQVYAAAQWWEAAYVVSKALTDLAPESPAAWICHANTVRNYKGVMEAWHTLLGIVTKFPKDAVIRYNLACYAAQLCLLEEACGWLIQAFDLEEAVQLKVAAIYDPDLQPLWDKIGRDKLFQLDLPSIPERAALKHVGSL